MAMDWHHFLKRYVWNENKTPYFTKVSKLHKGQANSEIFLYSLALSTPGALLTAAAIGHVFKNGFDSTLWVGVYAFSICVAVAFLHLRKSLKAALYTLTAPVVIFGYLYFMGFHPKLATIDHIVLIVVLLLWLRYTVRVAAIAKNYRKMPEKPEDT